MPATTKLKTVPQRAAEATRRLRTVLGLEDLKLLSAAIAEAAADEADRSAQFRSHVLTIYQELAMLQVSGSSRRPTHAADEVELIPLPGTEGIRIDPFGTVDPILLLRLYGPHQLRTALSGYSYTALKEAVSVVKSRYPKTKPKDGRKADALLDYIVEQIAPGN